MVRIFDARVIIDAHVWRPFGLILSGGARLALYWVSAFLHITDSKSNWGACVRQSQPRHQFVQFGFKPTSFLCGPFVSLDCVIVAQNVTDEVSSICRPQLAVLSLKEPPEQLFAVPFFIISDCLSEEHIALILWVGVSGLHSLSPLGVWS